MLDRWCAAAAIAAGLALFQPAFAASGGGPIEAEFDGASAAIDQIHPAIMQRARDFGLTATDSAAAAVTDMLQFPLRASGTEKSLQSHAVSNFVDVSSGSSARDFSCGSRTFDGHKGVDLFLWPYPWHAMDGREAIVVAALGGTIVGKHDGDFDRRCSFSTADDGNYVIVQHDNGLTGYYWHLQRGSVTTRTVGSRVETGTPLGFVGSSGKSTGPHLHFEVRNAIGAAIEPTRGSCNENPSRWAHQAAKVDTAIIDVTTHSSPPGSSGGCSDGGRNYDDSFARGQTVYAMGVFRDQAAGTNATIAIVRPDGSIAASWRTGSPSSGMWNGSYWWMSYNLPSAAPNGYWRVRVSIAGKSAEHMFVVGRSVTPSLVSATIASPARTVSAGQASNFRVTISNTGAARAIGCRLSLDRPILADTSFRRLDGAGSPVGPAGSTFNIAVGGSVDARLVVTPKAGFSAKSAEFPLRVTCTNTPPAPFSRSANMLVLSSP